MRCSDSRRLKAETAGKAWPVAALILTCVVAFAIPALSQDAPRLTGETHPMENAAAPPVPKQVTDDVRKTRAYPEQPPVIPHSIEGYQLTVNANRCLSCHRREFAEAAGAPMISITHFMTREGQMLADVSPRRYFCTMCHVPQRDVSPLVKNTFVDMSELGPKPAGDR
ncbi:nitrate reductase cytochrome c-type subunit [Stappia sp. ICDLI1TA098]|jgi:cytochrome c-type protein NapB